MRGYISRMAEQGLAKALARSPAVAILGPRQAGKSTLTKTYLQRHGIAHVSLDLQDRSDRNKLTEPELFLERHRNTLVCLDEIQLLPDFFPQLRVEIDKDRQPGRFLILGSASRDLLRQSTESLAGRIAFLDLGPFLLREISPAIGWDTLWLRGGFPDSLLAEDEDASFAWRSDFIRTFLERDIPQFGFAIPAPTMERLWLLLAHYHGQTLNFSKAAAAVDLSVPTFKKYLAILEQTYMVRLLPAAETNLKKRIVQAPKLYLRDSGLLHNLLSIETYDSLLAHPANGASWEGLAIENLLASHPSWRPAYLRTENGAEVDLLLEKGSRRILVECKLSKAPKPSRGFHQLIADLKPEKAWVAAPVAEPYEFQRGISVANFHHIQLDA